MLHETIQIKSKLNDYSIKWNSTSDEEFRDVFKKCRIGIVDKNVYEIYGNDAETFGQLEHVIIQEADEELKTAQTSLNLCEQLLEKGFKRGETLLAVGGGIIQDLVTFSASILFRGVPWIFVPTTLLAQADSCIGGKSSINFGKWKNQLGNFYPPRQINIVPHYLKTLTDTDIRSGLGEIVKVHGLAGKDMVEKITDYFTNWQGDDEKFHEAIFRALKVKANIIEEDEFDTGKRLTLNFGHTFGHAIETATHFGLSHGLAVAVGVDMAAYMAFKLDRVDEDYFKQIHSLIKNVVKPEDKVDVDLDSFIDALQHDKKNKAGKYCFILPFEPGKVERIFVPMEPAIEANVAQYFEEILPLLWKA
ncbi:MAG: 3-dehydroquinate synthase [bacterium]|nr:3-dehydroquinate synthase [bacterium]